MNILYITRKFPPSIGGMQTQSKEFYDAISVKNRVFLIAWGHSQVLLPLFMVSAFFRSIAILITKKIDVVQLGDMVLSPLGLFLKAMFRKPTLTVTHGRDAAYRGILYDALIIGSAAKLNRIICVSKSNMKRLAARGVPEEKMSVIPNGIDIKNADSRIQDRARSADLVGKRLGVNLKDKKIILSICRLVPKKGIKEFIEHVLPKINRKEASALFIVAGGGSEKEKICDIADSLSMREKVYLAGEVEHDSVIYKALFSISSVFVMPNVKVNNDAEGFGIAALEAGLNGVPLVAYDVDGISEAVCGNENGILIKEGEAGLFSDAVCAFLRDDTLRRKFADKAREYVINNFSWNRIAGIYEKEYSRLLDTTEENKKFYNELYKKPRSKRAYFRELEYFFKTAGDGANKVVVSIGNGDNEPLFKDQVVSDISVEGLRKIGSAHKCVVDAHNLPFKKDSIDIIYGWQVVHHLDIDKFFPQLKVALKSGGRAVFVDNGYAPQWRLLRKLFPKGRLDPKEDLREEFLAEKAGEYGFTNFKSKRFNFFPYLVNKLMRNFGFDVRLGFLESLDNFCSRWKIFRDNLRNMVWSFEK